MLRLRTFSGLCLAERGAPGTTAAGRALTRRRPLALLAVLAAAGTRGVTRDRLMLRLWADSAPDRARNVLKQTLYSLKRDLDEPELIVGSVEIMLNPAVITSDVGEFEAAIDRGDLAKAAKLYVGPFLDGFYLTDAPEFERWVAEERRRLQARAANAIRTLAEDADKRGDRAGAARWWRQLAGIEPASSPVAMKLVASLAATGDRAGALQAARQHEAFMRAEFDAPIDTALSALAEAIRRNGDFAAPSAFPGRDADEPNERVGDGHLDPAVAPTATSVSMAPRGARRRLALMASLAVVVAAAIAVVVPPARRRTDGPKPERSIPRVTVADFVNETGDTSLDAIGRVATDWVLQGLAQTQLVQVIGPGVRSGKLSTLGTPVANELVVRGSYSRVTDTLLVQARVVDATTGRVVRAVGPERGPTTEPLVVIERLRQRLTGALATCVDRRLARWADAASQPTSFEAYQALADGLNMFFSSDDSSDAKAGRLLAHAAALDSTFNLPLLWAIYAFDNASDDVRRDSALRVLIARRDRLPPFDRALLDAHAARIRGDVRGEYEALRRLVTIAPHSEWLYKAARSAAFGVHRFWEADSLLDALDPDAGWMREWRPYWDLRAEVTYTVGRHEAELANAKRHNARFPVDGYHRRQTGRALAALGRERELLAWVDDALGRSPPELDPEALLRIISAARVHGHLQLARAVAERALRQVAGGANLPPDSLVQRARVRVLVLEATERWDEAAASARELIRVDSLARHPDALPYTVLLQVALRRGNLTDTAGLEARALTEIAARSPSDTIEGNWTSESPLAVRAEIAALHRDAERTATALREAERLGQWTYFWHSERPAFDAIRPAPALAGLLHRPELDRHEPALLATFGVR